MKTDQLREIQKEALQSVDLLKKSGPGTIESIRECQFLAVACQIAMALDNIAANLHNAGRGV